MSEESFEVSVDTSEADRQLDDLQERSNLVSRTIVSQVRSSFDTLVLVTSTFGETLALTYQLMAQGLFAAAESIVALQAAAAAATGPLGFGLALGRFTLGGITAAALITRGIQLQVQGEASHADLLALAQGANAWRAQVG